MSSIGFLHGTRSNSGKNLEVVIEICVGLWVKWIQGRVAWLGLTGGVAVWYPRWW